MDTLPEDKEEKLSYTNMISINRNGKLLEKDRSRFKDICKEYTSVITPAPGKYSGYYGDSKTSINSASMPPPNMKVYTPNYSMGMNRILAEKMDQLYAFGDLRRP